MSENEIALGRINLLLAKFDVLASEIRERNRKYAPEMHCDIEPIIAMKLRHMRIRDHLLEGGGFDDPWVVNSLVECMRLHNVFEPEFLTWKAERDAEDARVN